MRVDEIYQGKKDKFLTVVCNLETAEPLCFGRERKKETLDEFSQTELTHGQRHRIEAACVDMWEPFRKSIEEWAPQCKIVYDRFHIMQHANDAVDEVRRAEFFRNGKPGREVIKGKRWLLLSRWANLSGDRGQLNELFHLNRRVLKAYLLKESLDRLWNYWNPGAMFNYLDQWIDQLKWQRLKPFEKLAETLLKHVDGIANYCRTKVSFGVVEAVNANIRMLINRGRGYQNLRYLLLKAKRMAVTNVEFLAVRRVVKVA
jgi:transposase